jgi:hypothetical protein
VSFGFELPFDAALATKTVAKDALFIFHVLSSIAGI